MGKDICKTIYQKIAGVAMLISDKVDFSEQGQLPTITFRNDKKNQFTKKT